MKRSLTVLTLLVLLLLSSMPVVSKAAGFTDGDLPEILATGAASGEYDPDVAVINIAVETIGRTASEAARDNADRAGEVIRELKKLIGPEGSIKTSRYAINPVYRAKDRTRPDAYRVTNRVTVRTWKLKETGKILDRAIESGANRIEGLSFELSDYSAQCEALLKEASRKARTEAGMMAANFDVDLGSVVRISQSCSPGAVMTRYYAAEAARTPIEAGGVKVTALVEAVFRLKE